MKTQIRKMMINAGVKNLKEFGYPSASAENILIDRIYSQLFKSMLKDPVNRSKRSDVERVRTALLEEIAKTEAKP